MNVEREIILPAEIRKRLGVPLRERFHERFERFQCDDPWRNARAKVLGQERAERLILPCLNVARAPIIHQDKAEDVIDGTSDWHRRTPRISRPDQECHFQFVIEAFSWTERWCRSVWRFDLAAWPAHVSPAYDNRAGASVIRHRQPFPVRHQSIL